MNQNKHLYWKPAAQALAAVATRVGLLAAALAILPLSARAQTDYPTRPLHLIVPYQVGGQVDTIARSVAEGLGKRLGQPVLVENKPGASGIIATNYVAKSAPDGYTLLLTLASPITANLVLFKKLPYDPRTELRPVSDVAKGTGVIVINSALPVRNIDELIAYARKEPGALRMGSWGPGSTPHLIQHYMNKTYGIDILNVPYKGELPIMTALLGGQIDIALGSVFTLKQPLAAGKIRALAVLGRKRVNSLPDVPSMAESGYDDEAYRAITPTTLLAPAQTPAYIVERLGREISTTVQSPEVRERLLAMDLEPIGNLPHEAEAEYQTYLPIVLKLTADTGVTLD
ncbi:Bug family tripartite tricarboxylate transporter substrate binding protein [Achromobacter aegrifaciens]|uniref:Bug family tripartite tricarboxylate transporter substrate binding protein n=1 Tax=Achromobacter aegrifaciens TaxID=1287736 RepID=UPI000F73AF4B|nr:tripartite tricarboxylate transporter substrate binding protein [Achromobacter aegrifaciens]RSF04786.1 tripartite tricarboxylate transporter substrate binding protein [Achromobacter aegrifaciens]